MKLSLIIIFILILAIGKVYCQVDTLMLVEVNNIEIIDAIRHLFVEDLDNDQNKELIICTDNFVYIYRSSDYELLWTSPVLNRPEELFFEDLNNDGLVDLSIKDQNYIYLFDPHNYHLIWTSDELDTTFRCYTLGDRNDDGWLDVVLVGEIQNESIDDTVYAYIYDGPAYSVQSYFHFMTNPNYRPIKVLANKFISGDNTYSKISIFLYYHYYLYIDDPQGPDMWWDITSGDVWSIYSINYNNPSNYEVGSLWSSGKLYLDENNNVYTVTYYFNDTIGDIWEEKYLIKLSGTDLERTTIWQNYSYFDGQWKGEYFMDDVSPNNDGMELCFAVEDSIYLLSVPECEDIWTVSGIDNLYRIVDIYQSSNMSSIVSVIIEERSYPNKIYNLLNGNTGEIYASITEQWWLKLDRAIDLNSDGIDEILSIQGNNLAIYNIEQYVNIENENSIPRRTFLNNNYPNPFNSSTKIKYGVANNQHVKFAIYNMLGQKVETPVDEYKTAGMYEVEWNADNYSSGIYYYRFQTDDYSKTKKMILLK